MDLAICGKSATTLLKKLHLQCCVDFLSLLSRSAANACLKGASVSLANASKCIQWKVQRRGPGWQ